jgi:hypothetical protein
MEDRKVRILKEWREEKRMGYSQPFLVFAVELDWKFSLILLQIVFRGYRFQKLTWVKPANAYNGPFPN